MLLRFLSPLVRAALLACLLAAPLAYAQKSFLTPEAAAEALVKAIHDDDTKTLQTVLGKDWKRFIPTNDLGKDDLAAFLAAWDQSHRITNEDDKTALLSVGAEPGFTLPIPIVKNKAGLWKFDVVRGAD